MKEVTTWDVFVEKSCLLNKRFYVVLQTKAVINKESVIKRFRWNCTGTNIVLPGGGGRHIGFLLTTCFRRCFISSCGVFNVKASRWPVLSWIPAESPRSGQQRLSLTCCRRIPLIIKSGSLKGQVLSCPNLSSQVVEFLLRKPIYPLEVFICCPTQRDGLKMAA